MASMESTPSPSTTLSPGATAPAAPAPASAAAPPTAPSATYYILTGPPTPPTCLLPARCDAAISILSPKKNELRACVCWRWCLLEACCCSTSRKVCKPFCSFLFKFYRLFQLFSTTIPSSSINLQTSANNYAAMQAFSKIKRDSASRHQEQIFQSVLQQPHQTSGGQT